MIQLNIHILVSLLSSVVILIMGICLLVVSVPKGDDLKNYRISRRFLSGAYIALATMGLWGVFSGVDADTQPVVQAFTVIDASYQSMLFTFAIITLINMPYMTAKRVCANLSVITLFAGALLIMLLRASPEVFRISLFIALALYCLQLIYYVWLFRVEYRRYKYKFDNFFSGDEDRRARWIKQSFYMAACVGIVAAASPFVSNAAYITFTVLYTSFYVYFAVKYISYLTLFHRISQVVVDGADKQGGENAPWNDIRNTLLKWTDDRRFLDPDITLESLSRELCTNHYYLSRFINSEYGQNFRSWINSLRITESIRLMKEDNDLSIQEISERIGIPSLSTFYRQFSAVTGMTPVEYRRFAAKDRQSE